jgi:alanine racemase
MGPLDAPSMQRAIDIDVSFAVVSRPMLEALSSLNTTTRPARVHLKIDTGMGRWGIHLDAARSAIDVVTSHDGVELEGIMTHFATADEADLTFTEQQLASFQPIVAHARAVAPRVIAHAANSAATLRAPKSHLDAVRCGVATYGLDPCQLDASTYGLKPVIALRSHVAEVRTLTPGESAGYGRTFIATDHVRVAEVPIGYADGLRRALSNQGHALIRGAARAMVGNISMDHVTLLVSDDVAPGDLVTLIGRDGDVQVSAEDHARWAATINYEITCGLAGEPRLLRTHVGARR